MMKELKDFLKVNEAWSGKDGERAYDEILEAISEWTPEQILQMIWNYFSDSQLKDLYKWMKQDEYIA